MRKGLLTLMMLGFVATSMFAQYSEVGVGFSTTTFMGDLGKHDPKASTYFGSVGAGITRPGATVWYRNTFNPWVAVKGSLGFTQIMGDDRLAQSKDGKDGDWYRSYRNLNFKSILLEAAITGEAHILRYLPGSMQHRWTPYISAGVGMIYFDPKTEYNGEWVRLQPLGTEGQGIKTGRDKYSLVQVVIPVGMGLKININQRWTVSGEIGHRITFTDYMDDVSTTYVSQGAFVNAYGDVKGQMVYDLSRRSSEVDPENIYGNITKPGEFRGNPKGNDSYLTGSVSVSFRFGKQDPEASFKPKKIKKPNVVVD